MRFLGFVIFFLADRLCTSQMFRFTTYRAQFWMALPFLAAYAAIVAWALDALHLRDFLFLHVALTSLWFFVFGLDQSRAASKLLREAGGDTDLVRFVAESARLNARYYAYSSFVYLAAFTSTCFWLYNR